MTTATAPTRIRVRVPTAEDFAGDEYLDSPDLTSVLKQLIRDYPDTHGYLDRVSVQIVWRAKGGKSKGKMNLGYCAKTSGLAKYFAQSEFVIWIAADTAREQELSDAQIRAAVSHEMRHIGWEDGEDGADGKAVILGHDFEGFTSELREIGAWSDLLQEAADAFKQAPLWAE